jgi:hypothetical protein
MTHLARSCNAGLASILVLTVCLGGCRHKEPGADLSKFLGTWDVVTGNLTLTCSTKQVRTIPVTEPIVFVAGTSSPLLDSSAVCPVRYDVSGNVATALPGQTCLHPKVVTRLNLEVGTFTTVDGASGTLEASGHEDGFIDIKMGWPVNCTFTRSASYKRVTR